MLTTEARELICSPHEWTAMFTVAAADLEEAARILRRRVDAANAAAGLTGWHFTCSRCTKPSSRSTMTPRTGIRGCHPCTGPGTNDV